MMKMVTKIIWMFIAIVSLMLSLKAPAPSAPVDPVTEPTENVFMTTYGNTQISAHRLGGDNAPENTLAAVKDCLENAEENPFDYFEMDVQLTRDDEIVVYHSLYLDELSDAAEHFGKENTTVFSKTYAELRELNLGEYFKDNDGNKPYQGLRGDDIPEDVKISKVEEIIDYIETAAPGKYMYTLEIKYPHPWAPTMVDKLVALLEERGMLDRVIIGSFWPDVNDYIVRKYDGKVNRAAGVFEIVDLYASYMRDLELNPDEIKYSVLQLPYYNDELPLSDVFDDTPYIVKLVGKFATADFIAYCHKYNLAVQFWTINGEDDMLNLRLAGADAIMSDRPDRANRVYNTYPIDEPFNR